MLFNLCKSSFRFNRHKFLAFFLAASTVLPLIPTKSVAQFALSASPNHTALFPDCLNVLTLWDFGAEMRTGG